MSLLIQIINLDKTLAIINEPTDQMLSHIILTKDSLMIILTRIPSVCRPEKVKKKLHGFCFSYVTEPLSAQKDSKKSSWSDIPSASKMM